MCDIKAVLLMGDQTAARMFFLFTHLFICIVCIF